MDHGQLKVRGRVIYRQAAGFGQRHDEQRGKSQKVARADRRGGIAQRLRDDASQVGRTRPERQAEDGHGDRRLGDGGHRHLAARSHSAKSRSRIKPGQREEEGSQQQQIDHGQQIAHAVEGPRYKEKRHKERHRKRAGENDIGHAAKQPRGLLGHDHFFAEQLDQLKVGLPRRCAAPVLQARLQPAHKPHNQRRQRQAKTA